MNKIAILVAQFYEHGGIEKLVAIKANYWAVKFKYDVTIVSTENKNQPLIYKLNKSVRFLDLGINYHRLKSYFSFKNIALLILNIVKIQKYILQEKPTIIVVAPHIPMTYILPFLYLGKTKIVKEFHFTKFFHSKKKGIKHQLLNYIEGKYDTRVVLSTEEQSFYKGKNIQVIPNPVLSNTTIKQIPIIQKELLAATVVRFAPVKRLELLVSIWEQFCKVNTTWKLLIYGPLDNDYAAQIQQLVQEKKLEHQIIFKGKTNQVLQELSKARVLLITSAQECFPLYLLEAQTVGVPVISFNCPTGPRNILHHAKDGLLVENDNEVAFVQTLQQFCVNEKLQQELSKNALENAKKYQLDEVMQQWKTTIFN